MSIIHHPTVCVMGATGSQGGALAQQLRQLDWRVQALVRNTQSIKALALNAIGVQLTQGDWEDSDALSTVVSGCDKLFLCLVPDFSDQDRERRTAQKIVNIAKSGGVKQVVTSTSLGVFMLEQGKMEPDTFMYRHLSCKQGVERATSLAGFESWTFLRPSFFMANFLEPKIERYSEPRDKGSWTTSMTADAKLALLDHTDVAKVTVEVFRDPERFHNKAIGLASEFLTIQETLDQLGRATGRTYKAIFMTDDEIEEMRKTSNVFVNSQSSMRYMVDYIDLEQLGAITSLTSFNKFLQRERQSVKDTYGE